VRVWVNQVLLLSHVILEEGIIVDSCKNQDMLSWNVSSSVIDIRSLLNVVGYCRKFIEGISKITKPMTEFLKEDKKFKWTPAYETRF
jgi:hypothetical protein